MDIKDKIMKLIDIVCKTCKEKVRRGWAKEKKSYRIKIKQGRNIKSEIKINHE